MPFLVSVLAPSTQGQSTIRVSEGWAGDSAHGSSFDPAISVDGHYIVISSQTGDLAPRDFNEQTDVFVHDLEHGTTSRISVSSDRSEASGGLYQSPVEDKGGLLVAFFVDSHLK